MTSTVCGEGFDGAVVTLHRQNQLIDDNEIWGREFPTNRAASLDFTVPHSELGAPLHRPANQA
jgi:hypothetical protein